jgi:hypothetical protein
MLGSRRCSAVSCRTRSIERSKVRMARIERGRDWWAALWRRADVAINQCDALSWGSLGHAYAVVLSRQIAGVAPLASGADPAPPTELRC